MPTIDPIRLAQFMVLPGAAELVEAFAALPPGEVRDSAVSHVQVLARACGWQPPGPFESRHMAATLPPPDPYRPGGRPPKLASPFAADLTAQSVEGQIVERALRGEPPAQIADDLRVKLGLVARLMDKARREGGVIFPGDDPKPAKPKTGKGRLRRQAYGVPVPAPPYWWEDQDSPIWENPSLLPTLSESGAGTLAGLGPLDSKSFKAMAEAAARHGQTMRQYIAQRFEILRRIGAGEMPTAIAIDLRISAYAVYGLLAKVGLNRMAVMMAEKTAVDGDRRSGAPIYRAGAQQAPTGSRTALEAEDTRRGPGRWGFPDLESYEAARRRVRELRGLGMGPGMIAGEIKQPPEFVKNALDHWLAHGVKWPPIATPTPRGYRKRIATG